MNARTVVRSTALVALALALPAAAHAQSPLKFGVALGPVFPTGDITDAVEWGYHVNAHIAVKPMMSPVGFRVEGLFQNLTGKGGAGTEADLRDFAGTANVELGLGGMGIKPYLIGGVGMYNSKYEGASEGSSDFGWNIGAGLDFALAGFSTFAEARYHRVDVEEPGTGNSVALGFVPVTFGFRF